MLIHLNAARETIILRAYVYVLICRVNAKMYYESVCILCKIWSTTIEVLIHIRWNIKKIVSRRLMYDSPCFTNKVFLGIMPHEFIHYYSISCSSLGSKTLHWDAILKCYSIYTIYLWYFDVYTSYASTQNLYNEYNCCDICISYCTTIG